MLWCCRMQNIEKLYGLRTLSRTLPQSLFRTESFLPLYQTECWHSHSKTLYLKYQSDLSCKYTCIREKRSIKITDNTVNI